jgi:hypothetical protein
LQTIEKLLGRHIWEEILRFFTLCQNQFVYEPDMSTENALHSVVTCIQNAVKHRQIALGAFLYVEGPLTVPLLKL